jgi:hypothetical protein
MVNLATMIPLLVMMIVQVPLMVMQIQIAIYVLAHVQFISLPMMMIHSVLGIVLMGCLLIAVLENVYLSAQEPKDCMLIPVQINVLVNAQQVLMGIHKIGSAKIHVRWIQAGTG